MDRFRAEETARTGLWGRAGASVLLALSLCSSAAQAEPVTVRVEYNSISTIANPGIAGIRVTVSVDGQRQSGVTDADGEVGFDLPAGEGTVVVALEGEGYSPLETELDRVALVEEGLLEVTVPTRISERDVLELEGRTPEEVYGTDSVPVDVDEVGPGFFFVNTSLVGPASAVSLAGPDSESESIVSSPVTEGTYFEGDEQTLVLARPGGGVRRVTPILDGFLPAVLTADVSDSGAVLATDAEVVSGALTDAIGSFVLPGDGGANEGYFLFGDSAVSNHRVYEVSAGGVTFLANAPFPDGSLLFGPANGGAQVQVVPVGQEVAVIASFSTSVGNLGTIGGCSVLADTLEIHATTYDSDFELRDDVVVAEVDGAFGAGCGPFILTNAKQVGDRAVGVQLVQFPGPSGTPASAEGTFAVVELGAAPPTVQVFSTPVDVTPFETVPFFNPALSANASSGSFRFSILGGDPVEGSLDGIRLGQDLWPGGSSLDVATDAPFLPVRWRQRDDRIVQIAPVPADGDEGRVGSSRSSAAGSTPILRLAPLPGCADGPTWLCLNGNRFEVTARFQTAAGERGRAKARPLSDDSGTFWFFEPGNRELITKVLDGCGVNGHYWLFAAGLTDVGVSLQATDTRSGNARFYSSALGSPFQPIFDVEAFPCGQGQASRAPAAAAADATSRKASTRRSGALGAGGTACGGDAEDLCLADGRFRVEVEFENASGAAGSAFGGNLTDDTGALFFFDPANVELLVKVLDACFAGNYWVFAAGLTDVGVELRVVDTQTGRDAAYRNPVGTAFAPIADTSTFPCS